MPAVLDLITEALVTIKALAVGETPEADMTSDALNKFNEVLESLSIQNLAVYASTVTTVPLIANQAAYILGPGGVGQRPVSMNSIKSIYATYQGVDFPIELVSQSDYDMLMVKSTTGIPGRAAFDNGFPNATLTMYPAPYANGTLKISMSQVFTNASALTDSFDMPPGYRRMVRLLLANNLLPDYPGMTQPEMDTLKSSAAAALAQVKRANIEPVLLRCEAADLGFHGGGWTDWRTGI